MVYEYNFQLLFFYDFIFFCKKKKVQNVYYKIKHYAYILLTNYIYK